MEKAKHSPGSWYIDKQGGEYLYIVEAVAGNEGKAWENPVVCALYEDVTPEDSVTFSNWYKAFENAERNALLIAAAPEMLAALEKAVEFLRPFDPEAKAVRDEARKAIAKAKGQA